MGAFFPPTTPTLVAAVFLVAMLYASVGHAGATGYIAVMTLAGLAAELVRPTALVLNVVVATIATGQFFRAGYFQWPLFWPLAAASVPCAAIGGAVRLPTNAFELVLGGVLLASAVRIIGETATRGGGEGPARPSKVSSRGLFLGSIGGTVGLLSGLTGVGGGVFLTPVLLWVQAAPVKAIAAMTAPFILANSLAGLAGNAVAGRAMPPVSVAMVAAAAAGGAIGSQLGAFQLPTTAIRLLMAGVLLLASWKLLAAHLVW